MALKPPPDTAIPIPGSVEWPSHWNSLASTAARSGDDGRASWTGHMAGLLHTRIKRRVRSDASVGSFSADAWTGGLGRASEAPTVALKACRFNSQLRRTDKCCFSCYQEVERSLTFLMRAVFTIT